VQEKKRYYLQINCTENQKNHLLSHARSIKIEAVDLDILFKPEDYVDGNMERGHLNQSGWDKLFNKKKKKGDNK
jgi:hypothetical protein